MHLKTNWGDRSEWKKVSNCLRHKNTVLTNANVSVASVLTCVPPFSFRPRAYYLADSDEESSSAGSSEEDDVPEASGSEKSLVAGAEG